MLIKTNMGGYKNKKILILDDSYGFYFFKNLNKKGKYSFSVRGNTVEPLKYYKNIIKNPPDVIIINIWFKTNGYSTPKGIALLEKIVSHYAENDIVIEKSFFGLIKKEKNNGKKVKNFKSKIIVIDDAGKWNYNKFSVFKYFNNLHFVSDRNIEEVHNIIENN